MPPPNPAGAQARGGPGALRDIHGSSTLALATRDGRHVLALNANADWFRDKLPLAEAEFCG
ncbi:hypothetical protein ACFVUH_23710 [Kitasatospora sp. NPDC058032]|uniref:hypothetical protein n=1 Tax=Kitasatospora sp. NPDC058032 TaxID=3346307 RepID=UPI0036D90919